LEKRQIIKFVVLIVEHGVARHAGMLTKPREDFVPPWLPEDRAWYRWMGYFSASHWKVRQDRNARSTSYDLFPSPLQHRMKARNQLWLSNVWKLPGIGVRLQFNTPSMSEKMIFMGGRLFGLPLARTSVQERAVLELEAYVLGRSACDCRSEPGF
jgi:hypothetical protein